LLGYETQEDYDRLLADLVSHLKPVGPIEEMLVDRIASCYWRLRRAVMAVSALIAGELDGEVRKLEKADKLYKYETMLEQQIYRALDQLEQLQRQRLGDNVPPPVKVRLEKEALL